MSFLKKRKTPLQNIAYMAIMAAINAIFVLLTTFVPVLLFLLVFILPLTHAIVAIYCDKRFYIVYAIATIGVCLGITFYNISDTFFYVIPSLITGFLFGLFIEKRTPPIFTIFVISIIQLVLSYSSIPLIKLMIGVDIPQVFYIAFGLNEFIYKDYLPILFTSIIAIGQIAITYIFINTQLEKTEGDQEFLFDDYIFTIVAIGCLFILEILFIFLYPTFIFGPFLFIILLTLYVVVKLCMTKKIWVIVFLVISLIVVLFLTAGLYKTINENHPFGLLTLLSFSLLVLIPTIINKCLSNHKDKCKINK